MEHPTISSDEFKKRLPQLCLTAKTVELPRRLRDRHILLKAISLHFDSDRFYTEPEVNRIIKRWLSDVGQSLEIDHVTLRRTLVDESYLSRAAGGVTYQVGTLSGRQFSFSEEINALYVERVIHDAMQEIARRRELYRKV
jgi:hypothetical protein